MAVTKTFKLAAWTGGRSYIQGVKECGGQYYIAQSRKRADGEAVVIRRHDSNLVYKDDQVLAQAGHGSSFGVELVDGVTRIWIGHKVLGVGFYEYGKPAFTKVTGVPNGDVAVDAAHDLLCVRSGSRYRGYSLSSIKAGKPKLLFDGSIRDWFKRFQGHAVTRLVDGSVVVLVHRDMATNGASRADWFRVTAGKLVKAGEFDSTDMGDEAEGFLLDDGFVWLTSRVGGTGSGRTVRATRTDLELSDGSPVEPPKPPAPKPSDVTPVTPYWTHVDPAKVSTGLVYLDKDWQKKGERAPRFNVEVHGKTTHNGKPWLVTEFDNRYSAEFLKLGKAPEAPKPPASKVTADQIAAAQRRNPKLKYVEEMAAACDKSGLPFFLGMAVYDKETGSYPEQNIFGHDSGGVMYGAGLVTEAKYREFRRLIDSGKRSNGVGPLQMTWKGFFPDAEGRGLKPWLPADNMLYLVELFGKYFAAADKVNTTAEAVRKAGVQYNGGSAYGDRLLALSRAWFKSVGNADTPDVRL